MEEKIINEVNNTTEEEYIVKYNNMVKTLKVMYQDFNVLHHNIVSKTFFSDHENLADMYEDIGDMIDSLIELGMTIGIKEPTIVSSIEYKTPIDVKFRKQEETFKIALDEMESIIELMESAKQSVTDDIRNKIEEYESTFRVWIYKISMLLEGYNNAE